MGSRNLFVRRVIGLFLESFVHLWMSVDAYMIYDLRSMISGIYDSFWRFVLAFRIHIGGRVGWIRWMCWMFTYVVMMLICLFNVYISGLDSRPCTVSDTMRDETKAHCIVVQPSKYGIFLP